MNEKKRIHMRMTIEEILSLFPDKAQKLSQEITNAGLHCIGCQAAVWETLEAGMLGHGMSYDAIHTLVDRLNKLLQEQTDLSAIAITPRAAKKYLEILQEEGKQGWGIRFSEKMAGCSGFEYILDYAEKPTPTDEIFSSQGIQIFIDKKDIKKLLGSEIDYIDGLQNSGFKITNPNVRSACSCGSSHSY